MPQPDLEYFDIDMRYDGFNNTGNWTGPGNWTSPGNWTNPGNWTSPGNWTGAGDYMREEEEYYDIDTDMRGFDLTGTGTGTLTTKSFIT